MSTVLVAGATGSVGSELCRRLVAKGVRVRALVRSTAARAKVDALARAGVELTQGDLKDGASLQRACRGVTTVYSSVATTISKQPGDSLEKVDRDGQLRLIECAEAAGAVRFLYLSFSKNGQRESFPLRDAKQAVEKRLVESSLTYTILRATYFMETFLSPALGFDPARGRARIYGSGENPVSWVSLVDVASFAAAVLDLPAARNAAVEVGGPQALSPLEVVRVFEEVSGKKMTLEYVPEEDLRRQLAAAKDPYLQSYFGLVLALARGDAIDMSGWKGALPVPMTTVEELARKCFAP